MDWVQKTITLSAKSRGFHLVSDEVLAHLPEIAQFRVGVAHFFILHTSASLSVNESADPTVRTDMDAHFDTMAPENLPTYQHTSEGPDDMPAHIKAALIGTDITIPIRDGRLLLGTWQGIYLGEHRDRGGARRIAVTLSGLRAGE